MAPSRCFRRYCCSGGGRVPPTDVPERRDGYVRPMAVGWVVVALALGAWSVVVAIRYDGRIYRWYVERAGESKGRMVGLVVGLHAASWLGWLLVWAAGAALDRGTGQ